VIKKHCLVVFFCLVMSVSLNATRSDSTKYFINLVVKRDLYSDFLTILKARSDNQYKRTYTSWSIEKMFLKHHSFQLSFGYGKFQDKYYNYKWFSLIPEYKYFVSTKHSLTGYYIGAGFKYWQTKSIPRSDVQFFEIPINVKSANIGVGIINGVQFYLLNRITIDALAGIGYFESSKYYDFSIAKKLDYRVALNFGFRF